jgi:sporadic carbohydrate cluster 2OG-Fe(II) oxygenase
MNFLTKKEKTISNIFLKKGYYIGKIENFQSLKYISNLIKKSLKKNFNLHFKNQLNLIHHKIDCNNLNEFRIKIINFLNKDQKFRFHYFQLAKKCLFTLAGNELMMQKNINLSIQLPNDLSSLLPIHSDIWSGDSPYEINLWIPLVDCYKTKSMYILEQKYYSEFLKKIKKNKIKTSDDIYDLVKKKIKWLQVSYGEFLIFNQGLPHGNIVNAEKETRWSLNCRFKTLFSPYEDKKVGEFFIPITLRPMTEFGINYICPFDKK